MANVDMALGLVPINMPYGNVRCRRYYCDGTQNTTHIMIGAAVVLDTTGTAIRATSGAGNYLMDAVVGCYDSSGAPIQYLTSSTAGYVLVADDPEQQFLVQEDGDSSDLATADVGMNVDLITAAGTTFRSRADDQLDSSSVTTSTNAQMRIIAKQDITDNAVGDYCKWIVKINMHQQNADVLGDSI